MAATNYQYFRYYVQLSLFQNLKEIYYPRWLHRKMPTKCVECDHLLVGDEAEYLYKGKSYCDDCYRGVKKVVTGDST
jgi:hypothetical protein